MVFMVFLLGVIGRGVPHYGPEQPRIQTEVLDHSLVLLLVRSHRSLICLFRTTRFPCALRCTHSLARSLTSLTPSLVGHRMIGWLFILRFSLFWPTSFISEFLLPDATRIEKRRRIPSAETTALTTQTSVSSNGHPASTTERYTSSS